MLKNLKIFSFFKDLWCRLCLWTIKIKVLFWKDPFTPEQIEIFQNKQQENLLKIKTHFGVLQEAVGEKDLPYSIYYRKWVIFYNVERLIPIQYFKKMFANYRKLEDQNQDAYTWSWSWPERPFFIQVVIIYLVICFLFKEGFKHKIVPQSNLWAYVIQDRFKKYQAWSIEEIELEKNPRALQFEIFFDDFFTDYPENVPDIFDHRSIHILRKYFFFIEKPIFIEKFTFYKTICKVFLIISFFLITGIYLFLEQLRRYGLPMWIHEFILWWNKGKPYLTSFNDKLFNLKINGFSLHLFEYPAFHVSTEKWTNFWTQQELFKKVKHYYNPKPEDIIKCHDWEKYDFSFKNELPIFNFAWHYSTTPPQQVLMSNIVILGYGILFMFCLFLFSIFYKHFFYRNYKNFPSIIYSYNAFYNTKTTIRLKFHFFFILCADLLSWNWFFLGITYFMLIFTPLVKFYYYCASFVIKFLTWWIQFPLWNVNQSLKIEHVFFTYRLHFYFALFLSYLIILLFFTLIYYFLLKMPWDKLLLKNIYEKYIYPFIFSLNIFLTVCINIIPVSFFSITFLKIITDIHDGSYDAFWLFFYENWNLLFLILGFFISCFVMFFISRNLLEMFLVYGFPVYQIILGYTFIYSICRFCYVLFSEILYTKFYIPFNNYLQISIFKYHVFENDTAFFNHANWFFLFYISIYIFLSLSLWILDSKFKVEKSLIILKKDFFKNEIKLWLLKKKTTATTFNWHWILNDSIIQSIFMDYILDFFYYIYIFFWKFKQFFILLNGNSFLNMENKIFKLFSQFFKYAILFLFVYSLYRTGLIFYLEDMKSNIFEWKNLKNYPYIEFWKIIFSMKWYKF